MCKFIVSLFLTIFSYQVLADMPLPSQNLTPQLVKELGFRVIFEVSSESGTTVTVAIPSTINECSYQGSFVEVRDKHDNVIAGSQTSVVSSREVSYVTGFIKDSSFDMGISSKYLCNPNQKNRGKVYHINSISDYLISTQNKSPNKSLKQDK